MMFTTTNRTEQFTGNCVARALYDNTAETPDELAFRKGDVLTVLEQNTSGLEGWWLCMLRGRQGICPANRLRLIARVYDTGGGGQQRSFVTPNASLNGRGGSTGSNSSSSSSSSNSSPSGRQSANPGLLSSAVRAQQQRQLGNGNLFRQNSKSITPIRQGDAFICAEECYDLPRSLARHDQLVRQESNTYQEPRPHFGVVNRQHSAPDEVDGGTEYDVPRPHLTRVQHVRTLSVDSSCEYDVPRPTSSTEIYDTPRLITNGTAVSSVSPLPTEECYDVPAGVAARFPRGKNPSDRSSGVSVLSSGSSWNESSSAARSASSEDSLSLSSAVGHISGRSSRSSIGIATSEHNQSMELYDVPPPAQAAVQQKDPIQEETYDVPKPVTESEQNDSVYDVPPPPVASVPYAGQLYDSPPPRSQPVAPEETYDCPPLRSRPLAPEETYDCPPPPRPQQCGAPTETYDSPKRLIELPAKASTVPLALEPALETLERLDAEVTSALCKLLAFKRPIDDWAEWQLFVLRLKASLQELCDFARGTIGNAVRCDDSLAVRLARLLRPLQDANSIVQKTSQEMTDLSALNVWKRPGSSGNSYDLDQLLACCRNLGEDMRQVVTFIHTNGHLLFSPTAKSQAKPTKQSPAGTDVGSTLPVVSDDYDYVNLESKDKFDQDNEEVKRTLPSEMKPAFDVLMAQSETLPVLPTIDQVSDNDRSVVEFYSYQVETYIVYLSNAIDSFIQTIEHNQPPKVFVAYSKFVILNAHKLLCVGDTVHRNVNNPKLKANVLERSNQLCQGLQTCVQSTKRAGREFPSVDAVQQMLDSVLAVSKLALELKLSLLEPMQQK